MHADDTHIEWSAKALAAALHDVTHDTVDTMLLYLLRVPLLLSLGYLAYRVGRPASLRDTKCRPCADTATTHTTAPLLINGADAEPSLRTPLSAPKQDHVATHVLRQNAETRKTVVIALLFLVSTVAQVYVGIKAISFEGVWRTHPAVMTM